MSLEAKRIRAAVVGLLQARVDPPDRVYKSRSINLDEMDLPCILVYTDRLSEEARANGGGLDFNSTIRLVLQMIGEETIMQSADDVVDDLTEAVKLTLLHNPDIFKVLAIENVAEIETQYGVIGDGNAQRASAVMTMDLKLSTSYLPILEDDLSEIRIKLDAIDPADAHVHPSDAAHPDGYGGSPGPDKRIEVESTVTLEAP